MKAVTGGQTPDQISADAGLLAVETGAAAMTRRCPVAVGAGQLV